MFTLKELITISNVGSNTCIPSNTSLDTLNVVYIVFIYHLIRSTQVWFEITLHFCHKGAESQEKLLKTSFQVFHDHNFRTYVSRTACEKSSQDTDEVGIQQSLTL